MKRYDAKRLARMRIRQVATWAGTWPALPPWLAVEHYRRPRAPNKTLVPIVRLHSDGTTERFDSVSKAARARGWTFETVRYLVTTGHADKSGSRYIVARV